MSLVEPPPIGQGEMPLHNPGGKTRLRLLPGVTGSVLLCGKNDEHRLWLTRQPEGYQGAPGDYALWIGRNPSTALGDEDDMTIRKELEFTRRLGFKRYMKVNFASYRATDPTTLADPAIDISHPENWLMISWIAKSAGTIIVACGNLPDREAKNALDIMSALMDEGAKFQCLGLTQSGWPRHSSRLAYATPFEPYEPIL